MLPTNNLQPKSTKTQTLNFVWANDSGAHIVDLSGSIGAIKNKLNANDPKNGLTKYINPISDVWEGEWTNSKGEFYKNDLCGNQISAALYSKSFYVSNGDGIKDLTYSAGNKFTFPIGDLMNTLFTDQAGTPYLTSFKQNVTVGVNDISLTIVPSGVINNPNNVSTNHFNANWTDNSNNKITMDVEKFINGNDLSFNPVSVDLSLNIRTNFIKVYVPKALSDVSNNLVVKMFKMGVEQPSNIIKYSNSSAQQTFIDISVNVLNANSSLIVGSSDADILNAQGSSLLPSIELMNLLATKYSFNKSGRQNLRIPITINGGVSGQWIWSAYIQDGNMKSSPVTITLKVLPSFVAPIVTIVDGITTLDNGDSYKVNLKVDDSNFTSDICNNLATQGLKLVPRFNAIGSDLVALYTNASNINSAIEVKVNGTGRTVTNAIDLCLNTLSYTDVRSSYVSGLKVLSTDLSLNDDDSYSKKRDVSTNISVSVIAENLLPSRSFKMLVDWLSYAEDATSSIIKPQTLQIGTFNIVTSYSSNVVIVNNKNGTYTLSLSDNNGNLTGANYRVRIFEDKACTALGSAANIKLDSQTNINNSSSNNFTVSLNENNEATFTGPTLKANTSKSSYYMVAYLEVNGTTYNYTASNKVAFTNTNYPTVEIKYDTTNAFRLTDINKIVSMDDNLDLIENLSDLSGFAIKSINVPFDLSCNLRLPNWDITSPTIKFTINDTNNVVKSFDISGNNSTKSSTNNSIVFNNVLDVSDNKAFWVDLSYNSVTTPCLFSMNIVFSDAEENDYSKSNKTVIFYYDGTYGAPTTNPGNKKNTLIVYNDTKYILDKRDTPSRITLGAIDTFDCYSWLAGSALNSYVLDIARSEFLGEGQTLDASGFKISGASLQSVSDNAILYIGFNGEWTNTNTNTNGVSKTGSVIASFARTNYSWIDTKKFVGHIDIEYNTKNTNGLTVIPNKLRLVIVPRPNIKIAIPQFSNVLVNTKSSTTATITNIAKNSIGQDIVLSNWTPADISGSKLLTTKLQKIMQLTSGAISLVTAAGTPDVANSALFSLAPIGNINYGTVAMPIIKFNGRSTAGLISSNLKVTYSSFGSKSVAATNDFKVVVYTTDSAFNNTVYTNDIFVNNTINFVGMPFVQYISLDNSNNTINLVTDSRTKNAAFVVIENKATLVSSTTGNITLAVGTTDTLGVGSTSVYSHTSSGWSFLYTKT